MQGPHQASPVDHSQCCAQLNKTKHQAELLFCAAQSSQPLSGVLSDCNACFCTNKPPKHTNQTQHAVAFQSLMIGAGISFENPYSNRFATGNALHLQQSLVVVKQGFVLACLQHAGRIPEALTHWLNAHIQHSTSGSTHCIMFETLWGVAQCTQVQRCASALLACKDASMRSSDNKDKADVVMTPQCPNMQQHSGSPYSSAAGPPHTWYAGTDQQAGVSPTHQQQCRLRQTGRINVRYACKSLQKTRLEMCMHSHCERRRRRRRSEKPLPPAGRTWGHRALQHGASHAHMMNRSELTMHRLV